MPLVPRAAAFAAMLLLAPPVHAQAPLVAEGCIGCHGPAGVGAGAVVALAGRDASELRAALLAFRSNERAGTIMGRVARGYTEAELAAVAEYFARVPR